MNNKKIRSIIVEDEIYDRKVIEKILVTEYSEYVDIVDSVDNIDDAVQSINKNNPELLFLDIELNGDRYGAFKLLQKVNYDFKIIFVTAKSDQDDLLKAIKLSCIDYLIKPTKVSDFEIPVKKVYEEINNQKNDINPRIEIFKHNVEVKNIQEAKMSLQSGFTYMPVIIKNILRCQAEGNYTKFFLTDKSNVLINGNLKSFEDRLTDFGFSRVSKSDLINIAHIKSFSRKNTTWEIIMADNATIYIAPLRKHTFLNQYKSIHL